MWSYMSHPYAVRSDQTMQEQNHRKQQQVRQESVMRPQKPTKVEKEEVWPEDVEQAFREALRVIPRMGRRKVSVNNKPCGRNELIADYIFKRTQKVRTRKQVSSHIQVCKNMRRSERTLKRRFGQAAKSRLMSKYENPNYENSFSSSSSDGEGDDSSNSDHPPQRNNDRHRKPVRSHTMPDFGSDTRQYRLPLPNLKSPSTEFLSIRPPSVYRGANTYSHSALPFNGRNDQNSPLFPPFHSRDFQWAHHQEESSVATRQHPSFSPTMLSTFQLPPLPNRVYPRTNPMSGPTGMKSLAPVQISNIPTKPAMFTISGAFTSANKQSQLHPSQSRSHNPSTNYATPPDSATTSVSRRPLYSHPLEGQQPRDTKNGTRIRHNSATEHPREFEPSVEMDMGCDPRHSSSVQEREDNGNNDAPGEHQDGYPPFSYKRRATSNGDLSRCSKENGRSFSGVNDFQLWPSQYRITMAHSVNPALSIFLSETHVLAQLECRPPDAYRNIPASAVYSKKFQYLLDINLETPCNLLLMKAKLDFRPHEGSKLQSSFFFESKTNRVVICDWIISSFGEIVLQHQERTETAYKDGKYRCQFAYIDDFFGALVSGIKNLKTWEAVDIAIDNLSISQIIRDADDDQILLMIGNEFERGDGVIEGYRVSDGSHLLGPMLDVQSINGSGDQSDPICVDDRSSPPATALAKPAQLATCLQIGTSAGPTEPMEETRREIPRKENHPYSISHNNEPRTPKSIHCSPTHANGDDRAGRTSELGTGQDVNTRKEAETLLSLSDGAVPAADRC